MKLNLFFQSTACIVLRFMVSIFILHGSHVVIAAVTNHGSVTLPLRLPWVCVFWRTQSCFLQVLSPVVRDLWDNVAALLCRFVGLAPVL